IASTPLEPALAAELAAAARGLGVTRFAVRSSATHEDLTSSSAAGVFESRVDVAPGDLEAAIRTVWSSAWGPAAWTYLRARSSSVADIRMAVLEHALVDGQQGTAFSRDP